MEHDVITFFDLDNPTFRPYSRLFPLSLLFFFSILHYWLCNSRACWINRSNIFYTSEDYETSSADVKGDSFFADKINSAADNSSTVFVLI